MGGYVLHLPILKRLFCEGIWKMQTPQPFSANDKKAFSKVHEPNAIVRACTFPFTSSQVLFSLLHSCEDWVKERFIVQDYTVPEEHVSSFLEELCDIAPIYPLWLCPVKKQFTSQLFAPHSLNGQNSINIGVYGVPNTAKSLEMCVLEQELALKKCQGRKWLYTHSCYTPDEFWTIYSEPEYRELRQKYHAEGIFISIEDKVLTN
jgi:hypothetical protein